MGEPGWRYAVLVSRAHWELERLTVALEELPEPPGGSWAACVRAAWGFFDGLPEPRAKLLVAALQAHGVDAIAAPENLLEELPPIEPVKTLALGALGEIRLAAAASYVETLRSSIDAPPGALAMAVRLVRLGLAATGLPLPLPLPQPAKQVIEAREPAFILDVLLEAPSRRLRVDARAFDFSCLGATKALDAVSNFSRLVAAVARQAQGRLNLGAERLAAGRPSRGPGYQSLADLEREERWLLSWRALRPAG